MPAAPGKILMESGMTFQECSRRLTILAFSCMAFSAALAQTGPNAPKEPVDAGAIVVPPKTGDAEAVEKVPPPAAVDPGMVAPPRPGKDAKAGHTSPPKPTTRNGSSDSSCTGPAELCKQSSPR
jgi:hypothetical protein